MCLGEMGLKVGISPVEDGWPHSGPKHDTVTVQHTYIHTHTQTHSWAAADGSRCSWVPQRTTMFMTLSGNHFQPHWGHLCVVMYYLCYKSGAFIFAHEWCQQHTENSTCRCGITIIEKAFVLPSCTTHPFQSACNNGSSIWWQLQGQFDY